MKLLLLQIASCAAATTLITTPYGEQLRRVPRSVDVMLVLLMGSMLSSPDESMLPFRTGTRSSPRLIATYLLAPPGPEMFNPVAGAA